MVEIDVDVVHQRLKRLYKHWQQNPNNVWGDADAVEIIVGKDTENQHGSQLLQSWLLGYLFTETIILLCDKKCCILTSGKKVKMLEVLGAAQKEDQIKVEVMERKIKDEENEEIFKRLHQSIKQSKKGTSLGVFNENSQNSSFIAAWLAHEGKKEFLGIDVRPAISDLFSVKDTDELQVIKKMGDCAAILLRRFFQSTIETTIEEERTVTHSELVQQFEDVLAEPDKGEDLPVKFKEALRQLQPDTVFSPIIQSGMTSTNWKFDISPDNVSNDQVLDFSTITCLLGLRMKGMCAVIGRSFMVDISKEEEENYILLNDVRDLIISQLKPGKRLCDIYNAALALVKQRNPALVPYLLDHLGFSVGYAPYDEYFRIDAKNTTTVRRGMAFCVFVCAQNVTDTGGNLKPNGEGSSQSVQTSKPKSYGLLIADTVMVPLDKDEAVITTDKASVRFDDVSYLLEDEEKKAAILGGDEGHAGRVTRAQAKGAAVEKTGEERRREIQQEIMRQKREEFEIMEMKKANLKENTADSSRKDGIASGLANGTVMAFKNPNSFPTGLRPKKVYVDHKHEAVLLPINGEHVPFHVSTIKSVSKTDEGDYMYMRINFHVPGHAFGVTYAPAEKFPLATFIKEISFRAQDAKNLTSVLRAIQELKKKINQSEKESKERAGLVKQVPLSILKGATLPKLKDVSIRPHLKGKKTMGTLECHTNGMRFVSSSGESLDVVFANIRHCFYQAATKSDPMVVIHLHLWNDIMIGKKKYKEVQFYADVVQEYDQLVGRYRRSMTDAEALEEEQREGQMREKLNNQFLDFAKKVERQSEQNDPGNALEFDIPYRELEFTGTPYRSSVTLVPTVHCLVSLMEPPFFVLSLDEVELVQFERVAFGLKNFDLVFVFKDYTKPVVSINSIPMTKLDDIKDWLNQVHLKYFEGTANLVWPKILKTIREDKNWEPWGPKGWNSILNLEVSSDEGSEDESDEEDEYMPSDGGSDAGANNSDEEDDEDDDDDDDYSDDDSIDSDELVPEEDEEFTESDSEDDAPTWEELEQSALKSDRESRIRNADMSDDEDERRSGKRRASTKKGASDGGAGVGVKRKAPTTPVSKVGTFTSKGPAPPPAKKARN